MDGGHVGVIDVTLLGTISEFTQNLSGACGFAPMSAAFPESAAQRNSNVTGAIVAESGVKERVFGRTVEPIRR
jgi:hypothetical protein